MNRADTAEEKKLVTEKKGSEVNFWKASLRNKEIDNVKEN